MRSKIVLVSLGFIISIFFLVFSSNARNKEIGNRKIENESIDTIIFHYESSFTKQEKVKLEEWLVITTRAVHKRIGVYPFKIHYYLKRDEDANEPVPWAYTERSELQGVHFNVNPKFSLNAFLTDWTAPHEISHLAIPFVGKSNSWFAEGFATYMQNEVLLEMNEMTEREVALKYKSKLDKAYPYYQVDEPFVEVAMNLRKQHRYPQMYWGGAYFFVQLDKELKQNKGISLCEVLLEYQVCCRLRDKSIDDIMGSFDSISRGSSASELIKDYRTLPAKNILVLE